MEEEDCPLRQVDQPGSTTHTVQGKGSVVCCAVRRVDVLAEDGYANFDHSSTCCCYCRQIGTACTPRSSIMADDVFDPIFTPRLLIQYWCVCTHFDAEKQAILIDHHLHSLKPALLEGTHFYSREAFSNMPPKQPTHDRHRQHRDSDDHYSTSDF